MRRVFPIILAAAALAGCKGASASEQGTPSLYDRLGGKPAITAVVDEFVARVAADSRINAFFAAAAADPARLAAFKGNLVDQVCIATGGPCQYKGKTMAAAHAGLGISHAHFVALVEDLAAALDKFKVPAAEKNELLGALAPLEPQIVTAK